ncbi:MULTISPECIES: FAD-dependent monooxygenase [unclassified Streptomyces]|uniref:FAD-dependent monooxygenase n=1 Tax=unclassified Streptomyces TaxID=2593676 RepID=UPI002DDC34E2|nr:FAD-dependent monooxygenase [Streptomyces sp. NBC_01750]WSB01613.1 FAD-dependent monooxygenase [Streptomyces sp. NBC_01794]WSD34060.1 FAD-dependent monooxygenase [Streptomyces sp. NBC_01750]
MAASESLDVLVVGAGPTGLALAAQLHAYGARFRIVDRHLDRARESRALAIQARTLEALAPYGVTDELVARGNRAVQLRMHFAGRTVRLPAFDIGVADTPYPFLLFLSQAETERVLGSHLAEAGTTIERGTELVELTAEGDHAACRLRHRDGVEESVKARYVVGCDGAHSTVRNQAGIGFEGHVYPQTFLLADLEVDELEKGAAHAYLTKAGMLFFFPLGSPASWRMLAMRPPGTPDTERPVDVRQLQAVVDRYVSDRLHLRDPVWMTDFRLHNRGAKSYRAGRAFLAGDAAHIHSPAGGQGMNTGIQDALNLGWKLALVCQDAAPDALLDTYESERAPVGRNVLHFTDRAFTIATSPNPLLRLARTRVAPRLAPLVMRLPALRAAAFRTISELAIHYRRSPATAEGPHPHRRGPRAGDRLPDTPGNLHAITAAPGYHLLLGGPREVWDTARIVAATRGRNHLLHIHTLGMSGPWRGTTHCLVRPDGYLAYRAGGADLTGLLSYLDRWLPLPEAEEPH